MSSPVHRKHGSIQLHVTSQAQAVRQARMRWIDMLLAVLLGAMLPCAKAIRSHACRWRLPTMSWMSSLLVQCPAPAHALVRTLWLAGKHCTPATGPICRQLPVHHAMGRQKLQRPRQKHLPLALLSQIGWLGLKAMWQSASSMGQQVCMRRRQQHCNQQRA